jgi:uncharacterized protein (DUF433 family)
MSDDQLLERIAVDPAIMVGKPVIRGTRLTVEHVLNLLGHGASVDDVVQDYPGLTSFDVQACLLFAGKALEDSAFIPSIVGPR